MPDLIKQDYSILDSPEILQILFYPRPDISFSVPTGAQDINIPVAENVEIGARFHHSGKNNPTILFFHGNGEIVSDYDDLARDFTALDANFLPVDYRGYGRSGGYPTVTSMMQDCHLVFKYTLDWLTENEYTARIIVMGRSLGSASALEIASRHQNLIAGLVIESGFASFEPLLELASSIQSRPANTSGLISNTEKIEKFTNPTLVIHAQFDRIIPFPNAEVLFEASGAEEKSFLMIPGADHNDLFWKGRTEYLQAMKSLIKQAVKNRV